MTDTAASCYKLTAGVVNQRPVIGGQYVLAAAWVTPRGTAALDLIDDPAVEQRGWGARFFRPIYPTAIEALRRLPPLPTHEREEEDDPCPATT